MYLYPENLTARPMLWLWTLRDVAFIGIGLLLSVLALTQVGSIGGHGSAGLPLHSARRR